MHISGQRVNDCLLMFLLISSVVSTGVAIARLRAEQLLLEALTVQLQAPRSLAVASNLLISDHNLLSLLLIY